MDDPPVVSHALGAETGPFHCNRNAMQGAAMVAGGYLCLSPAAPVSIALSAVTVM